jgi:NADPH-dependent 2,4-dienoyl-CoA reductase/sulfur reductase-like enzyme
MDNHGTANRCKEPLLPTEGFTLKDAPIENLRPVRVVVIGAGFSGILAAIRIPERLRNVELVVYEKNEDIGGVW